MNLKTNNNKAAKIASSQNKKPKILSKKPPLSQTDRAWQKTVLELGKLQRGSEAGLTGTERVKAIFRFNKAKVMELWEIYTQHRDELSRKLINNKAYALSYLLGFHLANTARVQDLMVRSNKRHHWNKLCAKLKVRLYDIGCGTGAMSAVFLQNAKASDVFLYDASGPLLDVAKILHQNLGTKNLRTSRTSIESLKPEWFQCSDDTAMHVYTLGYVWNELHRNNPAKRNLFKILTGHIERHEPSLIFIAEPALEHMSRPAMELRDALCMAGYVALYPCPASTLCPMMERPKDWCYSEGEWSQSDIAAWIDGSMNVDRGRHASTIFAFASPATELSSDQVAVVVGRPVKEAGIERYKGHFDYLICTGEALHKRAPLQPKQATLRGLPMKLTPARS